MGGSKAGAGRATNNRCTCSLPVCRWLTEQEARGGTTLPHTHTFSDMGLEQNHHLLRPCILSS